MLCDFRFSDVTLNPEPKNPKPLNFLVWGYRLREVVAKGEMTEEEPPVPFW